MSQLRVLVSERKILRKKVTDSYNRSGNYCELSNSQKLSEKNLLVSYKESLLDLDSKIQTQKFADDSVPDSEIDSELQLCRNYLDKIESCLPLLGVDASRFVSQSLTDSARSLLKQPTAPLPKFCSSENEDLMRFLLEFETTTSVFNYPDRDLLLLLKQQVEGRAKVLIGSLEADKQTYEEAKQLLIKAFASEDIRKFSAISKLCELKLGAGDDPFDYISKLRCICESVKVLDIKSDDFLKFFAWRRLDEEFKRELVQITTKTNPSIQEILDNFFTSCERVESSRKLKAKSSKDKNSNLHKAQASNTSSMAVKVDSADFKGASCVLCSNLEGGEG